MNQQNIICPKCGHPFAITDALTNQIRDQLKTQLLADMVIREEALKDREQTLTKEVDQQLKKRVLEVEASATKKAEEKFADVVTELKGDIDLKNDSIKKYREMETSLRLEKTRLEEAKDDLQLTVQRKLDEERAGIRKDAEDKVNEQHRLKDKEKEKVIDDLKNSLVEMQRKAEQGSMEIQGEVLEQDFEAQLKRYFLHDDIAPVPKGIRGADLIQTVRTSLGADCGVLLWETKNTKAWSAQWISKLKDDMIETRAKIAILVTVALPEGVIRFGMVDGVWVSDPLSAIPLAAALRQQLVALHHEQQASMGKSDKMDILYQYMSGTEFRQKIEVIIQTFIEMRDQVNRERRAMEKNWNEREKQIERVMKNSIGLFGDVNGIIGGKIAPILALELDGVEVRKLPESPDSRATE